MKSHVKYTELYQKEIEWKENIFCGDWCHNHVLIHTRQVTEVYLQPKSKQL
jgi:hypothetical protein